MLALAALSVSVPALEMAASLVCIVADRSVLGLRFCLLAIVFLLAAFGFVLASVLYILGSDVDVDTNFNRHSASSLQHW